MFAQSLVLFLFPTLRIMEILFLESAELLYATVNSIKIILQPNYKLETDAERREKDLPIQ